MPETAQSVHQNTIQATAHVTQEHIWSQPWKMTNLQTSPKHNMLQSTTRIITQMYSTSRLIAHTTYNMPSKQAIYLILCE